MTTARKARKIHGPKLDLRRQLREMGLSNIGAHKILFFTPRRAILVIASIAKGAIEREGNLEAACVLLRALQGRPHKLQERLVKLFLIHPSDFSAEEFWRIVDHAIVILPYFKASEPPVQ